MEALGSNLEYSYFLTFKTTSIVGQADMWAQPDTWVQADMDQGDIWAQLDTWIQDDTWADFEFIFEIEFEFKFKFEL
jgi:hypothetical protein